MVTIPESVSDGIFVSHDSFVQNTVTSLYKVFHNNDSNGTLYFDLTPLLRGFRQTEILVTVSESVSDDDFFP